MPNVPPRGRINTLVSRRNLGDGDEEEIKLERGDGDDIDGKGEVELTQGDGKEKDVKVESKKEDNNKLEVRQELGDSNEEEVALEWGDGNEEEVELEQGYGNGVEVKSKVKSNQGNGDEEEVEQKNCDCGTAIRSAKRNPPLANLDSEGRYINELNAPKLPDEIYLFAFLFFCL